MANLEIKIKKAINPYTQEDAYNGYLKSKGQVGMDELVERIDNRCTVTKSDIVAVLAAFQEQAIYALRNAQGVEVGSIGVIYPRAHTEKTLTSEEFTAENVMSLTASMRIKQAFKDKMQYGKPGVSIAVKG